MAVHASTPALPAVPVHPCTAGPSGTRKQANHLYYVILNQVTRWCQHAGTWPAHSPRALQGRTLGQDADHVAQAQRGQLEGALVPYAQHVERGRALKHGPGGAVAHVAPDDLRRACAHHLGLHEVLGRCGGRGGTGSVPLDQLCGGRLHGRAAHVQRHAPLLLQSLAHFHCHQPPYAVACMAQGMLVGAGATWCGPSQTLRCKVSHSAPTSCSVPGEPMPANIGSSFRYGETRASGAKPLEKFRARWHVPSGSACRACRGCVSGIRLGARMGPGSCSLAFKQNR